MSVSTYVKYIYYIHIRYVILISHWTKFTLLYLYIYCNHLQHLQGVSREITYYIL